MVAYASPGAMTSPFDPGFNDYYLNQSPEAGWWSYLMGRGMTGVDRPSSYAQGRFGYYQNLYNAQAGQNPLEGFYDWARRTQPDPMRDYYLTSPSDRGDATANSLYMPRVRWQMGA